MKPIAEQWADVEISLSRNVTAEQRRDIRLGFYVGVESLLREQFMAKKNGATYKQRARMTWAWMDELDAFWDHIEDERSP